MKDVTTQTFEKEAIKSKIPVVVDFWAAYCVPCKGLAGVLEAIETDRKGKLKIVKVDVQANQDLASRFSVMSVPTLAVFSGGKCLGIHRGAGSRATIERRIDAILSA